MKMSPFTSVQRIQAHLLGAHGLPEGDVNEAIHKMSHGSTDVHEATNQYAWRALHSGLHEADPHLGHHSSSTQLSGDEFDIFNDRRS